MKKILFIRFTLSALLIVLGFLQVFNSVSADSMPNYSISTAENRANCPQDTESRFFMGQDESYCYFEDMESGEIIGLDK